MRKGMAFTDVSEFIVKEPISLTTNTTIKTDTIESSATPSANGEIDLLGFNSFKLNWVIGQLTDTNAAIELRLYHSNITTAWEAVGTNDVIGPIDSDGNPEEIIDGIYRQLTGDMVSKGLFNNIYSVGYVGGKKYIKGELETTGLDSGAVIVAAWVTKMLIHTGKCDNRYSLIS